jgi:integrase
MTDTKRKFRFSTSSITKNAVAPTAGDAIYFDDRADPPGFGIRVGKARSNGEPPTRTWCLQTDVHGKSRRWSLGRFPTMGLDEAREKARDWYKAARDGRDPEAKPAEGATLRDCFERHVRAMKTNRKQPRSISDAEYDAKHYWGSYLDRALHTFTRVELDDIHQALTRDRGPAAADRACRLFRAAWRNMMRLHETLPDSPTRSIIWNGQTEERKPIAWGVFPEFWATIEREVKNPVRADLVRVLILTGLRSLDARTIVWSDIAGLEGDEPTLHRPNPKGGPRAAFTIPLSAPVARILRRRREENAVLFPGSPLVFPTVSRDNRVVPVHNAEEDALRPFGYFPHAARHTFASACAESGVDVLATKALLNHRSKDITEHYQKLSLGFIRGEAEKVAAFLLGKAGAKAEAA